MYTSVFQVIWPEYCVGVRGSLSLKDGYIVEWFKISLEEVREEIAVVSFCLLFLVFGGLLKFSGFISAVLADRENE